MSIWRRAQTFKWCAWLHMYTCKNYPVIRTAQSTLHFTLHTLLPGRPSTERHLNFSGKNSGTLQLMHEAYL